MGIFNFLFGKSKESKEKTPLIIAQLDKQGEIIREKEEILKEKAVNEESPFEKIENDNTVSPEITGLEIIEFKAAGTSHSQPSIRKAIKSEIECGGFYEQYNGYTNKEIKEETFGDRVYQYDLEEFSECELKLEPNNEYDPDAIAIYVHDFKVGYVPKKSFIKKRREILNALGTDKIDNVSVQLYGGKYKYFDDVKVVTGSTEYGLLVEITIKSAD